MVDGGIHLFILIIIIIIIWLWYIIFSIILTVVIGDLLLLNIRTVDSLLINHTENKKTHSHTSLTFCLPATNKKDGAN